MWVFETNTHRWLSRKIPDTRVPDGRRLKWSSTKSLSIRQFTIGRIEKLNRNFKAGKNHISRKR